MKRKIIPWMALLLCLLVAVLPAAGLAEEDDEPSYEIAHDLPTGIEEEDEPSYEIANDLPTGIEEDDEPSYEIAHDLPTGIEELYAYVKTANGKGLNLRAQPSTRGTVIAAIPYGAQVLVTGYYSSSWAAVEYGNHNGYCMTRYLSDTKPRSSGSGSTPVPVPSTTNLETMFSSFGATSYSVIVVPSTPTGYVNLRWAPTKNAPMWGVYRSGSILQVIAEGDGWSQVYEAETGTSGFMMSQYLTRIPEYGTVDSALK